MSKIEVHYCRIIKSYKGVEKNFQSVKFTDWNLASKFANDLAKGAYDTEYGDSISGIRTIDYCDVSVTIDDVIVTKNGGY
jgi:hypothetical protein